MVTVLDNSDTEHFHHGRQLYGNFNISNNNLVQGIYYIADRRAEVPNGVVQQLRD